MVLRNLVRNWVIFADPGEADDDSSNRALNIQTGKRIESKLKKTRVIRSLDYDRIFFPTCSNFLPFLPSPRSMEKFPCNLGRRSIVATLEIIEIIRMEYRYTDIPLSIYRNRSSIYTDNQCSNVQRFGRRADFSIYASPRARPKYGKMLPRVCFFSGISPTRYTHYMYKA